MRLRLNQMMEWPYMTQYMTRQCILFQQDVVMQVFCIEMHSATCTSSKFDNLYLNSVLLLNVQGIHFSVTCILHYQRWAPDGTPYCNESNFTLLFFPAMRTESCTCVTAAMVTPTQLLLMDWLVLLQQNYNTGLAYTIRAVNMNLREKLI